MLTLKPANSGGYRAYWSNGALVGDVYREVDGYYVFWPLDLGGFWDESLLRCMADELHRLNQEWDKEVRRACCGPSSESTGRNYLPSKDDSCPF